MVDDELYTLASALTYGSPAVSVPVHYGHGVANPASTDYPHVVFWRVSAPSDQSIDAAIVFTPARYQFSCFATTHRVARQVADALISLLQGGTSTTIKAIEHENDFSIYDPDTKHEVAVDFIVSY